jgi:hypothetical protein
MRYMKKRTDSETDFDIYNFVFETAAEIFEEITGASKSFSKDKVYLADLACKHSKLVCIKLAEAWRMKEHKTFFLDKLSEAAQAASKTQDVLKFASKNNYIDREIFIKIDAAYENIFEDIFSILCEGKKFMNYPKGNGKRGSADRDVVAVAQ